MAGKEYKYLDDYVFKLRKKGLYLFTLHDYKNYSNLPYKAVQSTLLRGVKSNKIARIRKGFYVVIPPEYSHTGMLPPSFFIDEMMKRLNRNYYVSLLSAAALHGAAHQKPMTYFVMIEKPSMRNISNDKLRIKFTVKASIPQKGIEQRKTETGYINISSPELTAFDLIRYETRVGGLDRVLTVLDELVEEVDPAKFTYYKEWDIPVSCIQRIGYILDVLLDYKEIAKPLLEEISKVNKLDYVPFKASKKYNNTKKDTVWKIYINAEPESDL